MTFYEEIKNIEEIINCIETENREYAYQVEPYMLELPSLLKELIGLKSEMNKKNLMDIEFTSCKRLKNGKFKLKQIRPLDKIIEDLKNHVEYITEENKQLESKIEELKNLNRDKEIERLKEELNQTHKDSIYILSKEQKQKIKEFKEEHNCHEIGKDRYSLIITSNELFDAIEIKCNICGQSEDLTDWSLI